MLKIIFFLLMNISLLSYAEDAASPSISTSTQVAISPDAQALNFSKLFFHAAKYSDLKNKLYPKVNFNRDYQHD